MDQDTFCSLKRSGFLASTDTKKASKGSVCVHFPIPAARLHSSAQGSLLPSSKPQFYTSLTLPHHDSWILNPFKDLCDEDGGTQISQDNLAPPIARSLTWITSEKCHFPRITQLRVPGTRVWTYSGKPFFCLRTSLSESQSPHLYNRRDNGSYFTGL